MRKELAIIVCIPEDLYWASEIEVQLNNFRRYDMSKYAQIIIHRRGKNKATPYWDKLIKAFPETGFFIYEDNSIGNLINMYAPIMRPHLLKKHWEQFPELKDRVILYLDSDVIFTRQPDFSSYLEDDVCYMSKTSYIGANYFMTKEKDVYSFKLDAFRTRDILQELATIVGVSKQTIIDNEENTGGCQYLLKNIDSKFWEDVENTCIALRIHMQWANQQYFPSEEKGFQSWCADMQAVLWNLWKRGVKTSCPTELDFAWSSSPIEEYDRCIFLHNAGILSPEMELGGKKVKVFFKSDIRFRKHLLTFFDLDYSDFNCDPNYCSSKYLEEIRRIKDPITKTNCFKY